MTYLKPLWFVICVIAGATALLLVRMCADYKMDVLVSFFLGATWMLGVICLRILWGKVTERKTRNVDRTTSAK
jgi:hypothetical protein